MAPPCNAGILVLPMSVWRGGKMASTPRSSTCVSILKKRPKGELEMISWIASMVSALASVEHKSRLRSCDGIVC